MTMTLLVEVASMLMAVVFALVLGAQMFDAFVNQPVFFSDPPNSVCEYAKLATAHRVPLYFTRLIVPMMAAIVVATVGCIADRGPAALFVSLICGILYVALIFLFFLPTNRKLGFLPPEDGARPVEPELIVRLTRRWRAWNRVRICLQFVGLVAAILAMSVAK